MAAEKIISVNNLVKVYPNGVRAVDGISFFVKKGEFFGFIGPNGAGKSTTIKILSTLIRKTSGKVSVTGFDVDRQPVDIRKNIGFAMQSVGLDDLSTGWDFLVTQGLLYGQSKEEARRRAKRLVDVVGLSDAIKRKVGTYSGGMQRRIDLAAALMHSPTLLFLDEPTTGLDPQSRNAIWEYIRELNTQGITIFLTTQIMEEADKLCERIAIIDIGKIVAEGTPKALKEEVGGDIISIELDTAGLNGNLKQEIERAIVLVKTKEYIGSLSPTDNGFSITARNGGRVLPDILRTLQDNNIAVANLSLSGPTLDDVFIKYTGKKIRSDETTGSAEDQALRPFLGVRRGR